MQQIHAPADVLRGISSDSANVILHYRPANIGPRAAWELTEIPKHKRELILSDTGCIFIDCYSIPELNQILSTRNVSIVEFYWEWPTDFGVEPYEFVDMLKRSIIQANSSAKLAVVIRHWTPYKIVQAFKDAGVNGVTLHGSSWDPGFRPMSLNEILLNSQYWPEDIIRALPRDDDFPSQIYFGSHCDPSFDQSDIASTDYTTKFCNTWKDLTGLLNDKPNHIVFHIQMVTRSGVSLYEFISMIETLVKFVIPNSKVLLSVAISADTHYDVVKEIKKTSAIGIVPSTTGFNKELTVNAINSIMKGHAWWPAHIIAALPGAPTPKIRLPKIQDPNIINLTFRQREVFGLVARRGLSNKKIAKILSISESTVKIHVSAIMKAYKVQNRTQLALIR